MNLLTMLFVVSNVRLLKLVLFKKHANVNLWKPSVKRKRKSEAARKRKNSNWIQKQTSVCFCFSHPSKTKNRPSSWRSDLFIWLFFCKEVADFSKQLFLVGAAASSSTASSFTKVLVFFSSLLRRKEQYQQQGSWITALKKLPYATPFHDIMQYFQHEQLSKLVSKISGGWYR